MEPAGAPQSGSGAQIDQSQMLLLRGWLCLSCLQNAAPNRFLLFWTFFPTFLPWIYTHRVSLWHTLQTKNIWFCHIRGSVCWEVSLGALVYPECSCAEWQTYTDDTIHCRQDQVDLSQYMEKSVIYAVANTPYWAFLGFWPKREEGRILGNHSLSCWWGVWPHWENWAKWLQCHTYMYFFHNILLPQWVTSRPPTVPPFRGHPKQQLSPLLATRAGNDFTRREWGHTVRQRPPSTPGQRLAESLGSVSAGAHTSAHAWDVCEGRPLISGRRWTVWVTHVFVWAILRNVRHVWLSVHMCFVLFFHKVCSCMCVCAARSQVVQVETYDITWTLLIAHLCTAWQEVCVCPGFSLKSRMTFFFSTWPLKQRTEGGHFPHTDVMI